MGGGGGEIIKLIRGLYSFLACYAVIVIVPIVLLLFLSSTGNVHRKTRARTLPINNTVFIIAIDALQYVL